MPRTFWHPMTERPTEPERWNTFVVAYPNPRFYRSKFSGEPEHNGIPPYVFDVAVWTGTDFAHTQEIKYWARIPSPTHIF